MAFHTATPEKIHKAVAGMLIESIEEKLVIARYCITNYKNDSGGVYGYAAATLLLSVVDTLGSFLIGVNVEKHFEILKHPIFSLNLSDKDIAIIYDYYRSPLTHNSVMPESVALDVGKSGDPIFENRSLVLGSTHRVLNLAPFLVATQNAFGNFKKMDVDEVVRKSKVFQNLLRKPRVVK